MAQTVTDTMLTQFGAFVSGIAWVAKYVHYMAKALNNIHKKC
jgi:hypothetical protein